MGALVATSIGSFVVGLLGGVLGAGGGVFLVPFLVLALDLRPVEAVGVSLFCVVGTSAGAVSAAVRSGEANLQLASLLEPFLVAGSVAASFLAHRVADAALLLAFAALLVFIGLLFVAAAAIEAPPTPPPVDEGVFDGATRGPDGATTIYRPRRLPALAGLAAVTGMSSGLFGIGGGVLVVPAMTWVARVPLRAAAATSAATLMVTGAAGGAVHLAHGTVPASLAAASLLGVIPGGRLGARLQTHMSERALRLLFAALALVTAGITAAKALGATR